MTVKTRAALASEIDSISGEVSIHALTPTRVGGVMRDVMDSSILSGEATTPPTAGNGLTGTSVFSVLPDGTTLSVSASGVKISDMTGPGFLGRAGGTPGAVVPITGSEGGVARILAGVCGFGSIATAGITDGAVTPSKLVNGTGLSLLGRSASTTGVYADITSNVDGSIMRQSGAAIGWGTIVNAGVDVAAAIAGTKISPDFGSQNITTTGNLLLNNGSSFLQLGLAPGSGSGVASAANAGGIRLARGGSNNSYAFGRSNGDSSDVVVVGWDSINSRVILGDPNGATGAGVYLSAGIVQSRVGTNSIIDVTSTKMTNNQARYTFNTSSVTPIWTQEDTNTTTGAAMTWMAQRSTAASGTGGSGTFSGADVTGAAATGGKGFFKGGDSVLGASGTRTGGDADFYPGAGATTGGKGRLVSGGTSVGGGSARASWNDTGLSFFAASIIAQASRVGQLTDSTTGTPSTTIGDVGGAFNQATLNNIHASLLAKINALETVVHNLGLTA